MDTQSDTDESDGWSNQLTITLSREQALALYQRKIVHETRTIAEAQERITRALKRIDALEGRS